MATYGGPNINTSQNLVFAFDIDYFPAGWGVTQLIPNSDFVEGGVGPYDHGCYTSGYYLGPGTSSILKGGTLRFTGADLSNYYISNPEYRGWDAGSLGNTGGNWMHYVVLPTTLNAAEDYIVETRARFVYVSRTGNGSANPRFQIGRHYYEQYGINYSELGMNFKTLRFSFNGNSVPVSANDYFTFGCTSADAMVELDYLKLYRIEKSTGLKNLVSSQSLDITNVSFTNTGKISFDGTNDEIILDSLSSLIPYGSGVTVEALVKFNSFSPNDVIVSYGGNGSNDEGFLFQYEVSSGLCFMIYANPDFGTASIGTSSSQQYLNQYIHILGTYNGSVVKLYINGVEVASTNFAYSYPQKDKFRIGNEFNRSYYSNMDLKFVKIYNTALLPSQVLSNYNRVKNRI